MKRSEQLNFSLILILKKLEENFYKDFQVMLYYVMCTQQKF